MTGSASRSLAVVLVGDLHVGEHPADVGAVRVALDV
jgi:hypothetical protein